MRNRSLGSFIVVALFACSSHSDSGGGIGAGAPGKNGSAGSTGMGFGNAPQPSAAPTNSGVVNPNAGANARGVCEVVHLDATPTTPDMLIVLDRSGSMGVEGRWAPSVSAVRSIVTNFESQIRFGLALFPDPASTGGNTGGSSVQIDASPCLTDPDPIACLTKLLLDAGVSVNVNTSSGGACAPGKIVVPVDLNNAAAIGKTLDMTSPNGGTPTPDTLKGLLDQFAPAAVNPDALSRPKFILLVTDGQPTCPTGAGSITNQTDIDSSNAAIEELTKRGARTYVIGYNTTGPGNEAVAGVLDGFATRGGTGDMHHRPVEDEQSLRAEFQRIAGAVVSCTFVLDKAPPRADFVLVKVDGKQVNLNDANGWRLVNQRTVELTGTSCTKLQGDGDHAVDAEVRCEVVQPQ